MSEGNTTSVRRLNAGIGHNDVQRDVYDDRKHSRLTYGKWANGRESEPTAHMSSAFALGENPVLIQRPTDARASE